MGIMILTLNEVVQKSTLIIKAVPADTFLEEKRVVNKKTYADQKIIIDTILYQNWIIKDVIYSRNDDLSKSLKPGSVLKLIYDEMLDSKSVEKWRKSVVKKGTKPIKPKTHTPGKWLIYKEHGRQEYFIQPNQAEEKKPTEVLLFLRVVADKEPGQFRFYYSTIGSWDDDTNLDIKSI